MPGLTGSHGRRWDGYDSVKTLLEVDSQQRMDEYLGRRWYERAAVGVEPVDSRNGFYERDYGTPWGIIRFREGRGQRRRPGEKNQTYPQRAVRLVQKTGAGH